MSRDARIYIGDSLRRIGGFGLLAAALPALTSLGDSDGMHIFRWILLGSVLTVVVGQLVYVWGGGLAARRAKRAAQAAADKPTRPTEPRRPATAAPSPKADPPEAFVMMSDPANARPDAGHDEEDQRRQGSGPHSSGTLGRAGAGQADGTGPGYRRPVGQLDGGSCC